jgi:hypothetical protein
VSPPNDTGVFASLSPSPELAKMVGTSAVIKNVSQGKYQRGVFNPNPNHLPVPIKFTENASDSIISSVTATPSIVAVSRIKAVTEMLKF